MEHLQEPAEIKVEPLDHCDETDNDDSTAATQMEHEDSSKNKSTADHYSLTETVKMEPEDNSETNYYSGCTEDNMVKAEAASDAETELSESEQVNESFLFGDPRDILHDVKVSKMVRASNKDRLQKHNVNSRPDINDGSIMGPKKVSRASSPSKKKARNTIEFKKEIIEKYENGIKIAEIGRMYGKSPSTISSIVAKKEAIKEANVAKGVNVLTKQRSQTIEDVEQLLLIWINEKQLDGDSVSEAIICETARLLYADLIKKTPGRSDSVLSDFKASRGWLEKFKRRTGIQIVTRHGGGSSSDKSGVKKCVSECKDYVEAEGFIPQQVSICDETGLFYKKMPKRTFITKEEGFEPSPDDPSHVVQSVVDLGKSMDLEVSGEDVEELVNDHSEEFTTEDPQDLHPEVQQVADEEVTSDVEEETGENVPSSEIKDIFSMWSKVQRFVEKNHPDKAVAGRVCNLFNDNVLPHFRQILKRRQKQTSLDSFHVRHGPTNSEADPSAKRPRRELTPDSALIPKILTEGDSSSKQ